MDIPKIKDADKAGVRLDPLIELTDERRERLRSFLSSAVRTSIADRERRIERVRRWRKIMGGENPEPRLRSSASHVSVPLIMWAVSAVHSRITQSLFGQRPFLNIEPLQTNASEQAAEIKTALKKLTDFTVSQILDPRGLRGRRAVNKGTYESSVTGLGAVVVLRGQDEVQLTMPGAPGDKPGKRIRPGMVTWEPVAFDSLVVPWTGYGTDVMDMPFAGYEVCKTWGQLSHWAALGHYDRKAVERVRGAYEDKRISDVPATHVEHRVAELYIDFDLDGDGAFLTPVIVDWHLKAEEPLRIAWNTFDGYRPMILLPFDLPPDVDDAQGQGIAAKLESPQIETNAIHNIGIEAGKRAAAFIILIRRGSAIDDELGGENEVIPGDVYSTEDIATDLTAVALGKPEAIEPMLVLEETNRQYVFRLLGLDEGRLGNIEAGKRVPASLGMSISREGRVPVLRAIEQFSESLVELVYLTLEAWRQRPPVRALSMAIDAETTDLLTSAVLSPNAPSPREQFRITVQAQDVATAAEEKKNELMVLNQFLLGLFERMTQMVILLSNPQVPPQAKPLLGSILEKTQNAVRMLLSTLDSVKDPSELLLGMSELQDLMRQVTAVAQPSAAPSQSTSRPAPASVAPVESDEEDMGGGIA